MITVRFPNGFSVQYNNATYVCWSNGSGVPHRLFDRKDGNIIASAPSSCVIEFTQPCRTYDARIQPAEVVAAMLRQIRDDRGLLPVYKLAELKSELRDFDALRKVWKSR